MAYVSIRWGKSSAHHLNYALKDRAPDDATYAHDCSPENAIADFAAVRAEHDQEGGNHVLHVMQSLSPSDSRKLTPEEFNAIGRKLAFENFQGHQFAIRTHTDTNQTHNHIVINTVNSETGKKIENKRALIFKLQDSSDKLCLESGLSIINRDAKERAARLPYKVQQMVRAGKKSYIYDLSQKADVSRSIATNFNEYRDTMHAFGIRVLIEEKNISYFYPGQERGKRGSKLGRLYDKSGLLEAFTANREKFANNPELKAQLLSQSAQIQKYGMPKTPEGVSRFQNLWSGEDSAWLVPTPKISRRDSKAAFHSDRELTRAFVPANEIKQAKGNSIFEYCERNKIALTKNAQGETVFKGKEFVTVSEFEFKNTKNGTSGSLIDLVAAHKSMTLLQAVAHINGNNRLLLLERHAGEVSHKFRFFYVPKPEKSNAAKIASILSAFSQRKSSSSTFKANLSELTIERVGQRGGVWLLLGDESKSDHSPMQHGLAVFAFAQANRITGVPTLDHKSERSIDLFLIENPGIKTLNFVSVRSGVACSPDGIFLNILKKKYESVGINIVAVENEKALQKTFEIDTRAPDRSRGKGGPDISF